MKCSLALPLCLLMVSPAFAQRRPPVIGRDLPDPGPHRIEVRFALGEKPLKCRYFHLRAILDDRTIMDDRFAAGFPVPPEAEDLPNQEALELYLTCGKQRWHFTKVPENVFTSSWWWVGTDYPPFQETLQGYDWARDAIWIRYLIVDPQGFFVERHCPAKFEDQKPGPCYIE